MTSISYEIANLAKGGQGVARVDSKVYFIEGALPGEKGTAEIIADKAKFGRAIAISRENDAPCRAADSCPHAGKCGGCGFRHVLPEHSLALKAEAVWNEIAKIAHISDINYELYPLPADQMDGSRARVRLHVNNEYIGYFARESHNIVQASACPVIMPKLRDAIHWLEENLQIPKRDVFDIQIDLDCDGRAFAHFKPVDIVDKSRKPAPFHPDTLYRCVQMAVRSGAFAGVRLGERTFGESMIRDEVVLDNKKTVSWRRIGDFSQAAPAANIILHRLIAQFLDEIQPKHTIDLYAGSGNFAFREACSVRRIDAFEKFVSRDAFDRGRKDSQPSFVPSARVELHETDLYRGLPAIALMADAAVCDPAREGLSEKIIRDFKSSKISAILYISCEAASLARDISRLAPEFTLRRIGFADMFPMTPHVETAAVFTR